MILSSSGGNTLFNTLDAPCSMPSTFWPVCAPPIVVRILVAAAGIIVGPEELADNGTLESNEKD